MGGGGPCCMGLQSVAGYLELALVFMWGLFCMGTINLWGLDTFLIFPNFLRL